jgi:hypothetical protein
MKRTLILGLLVVAASSQALMVDYSSATLLGQGDDSNFSYTLGGNFNFYGAPTNTVGVCTNGFIGSATNFGNVTFPTTTAANIAPFWDDWLSSGAGQGVFGQTTGATGYDTITWNTGYFSSSNGTGVGTFQAILVRNNSTIQGVNFLAGDIIFNYDSLGTGGSGTVGLNQGDGVRSVYASGLTGSATTSAQVALWTAGRNYYLFRPDGNGGYTASQGAAVPEPASMAALGLGALALLRRRRKA